MLKDFFKEFNRFIFMGLLLIYIVLVFSVPVNHLLLKHYNISITALRFIELTYVIPLVLIWSLAFYGYTYVSKYANSISKSKDGVQMTKIGIGIGVLAFGGPLSNIISTVLGAFAQHYIRFVPSSTIIGNYIALIIPLIAFIFIGLGARGLADTVKAYLSYKDMQILAIFLILVGTLFCYLIFHSLPGSLKLGVTAKPIYYLPNWLLLFTIVIPYISVWFYGSLAAMHVKTYYDKVRGSIYKSSLKFLASGIGFIVISYIVIECLTTVSSKLITLKISSLLLIIYPLLILISIGYILIAIGAKKLRKIEES